MLDEIAQRNAFEKNTNQHGHTFVEFLTDAKCCVLNGRLFTENDNFTSTSTRGKAGVDYVYISLITASKTVLISEESPRNHKYTNTSFSIYLVQGANYRITIFFHLTLLIATVLKYQMIATTSLSKITHMNHSWRRYKMNRMQPNFM